MLFLHWEVPFDVVRRLVPPELEIDTHGGRAYVALVPFKMREICPPWLPKRLGFNFYETNVRTYVSHQGRPGVYFFSLDANSRLAVWAARLGWSLPYYYAKMTGTDAQTEGTESSYQCQRGNLHSQVSFEAAGELQTAQADSLEHFLLERYLLFVKRHQQIHAGQVHHAPYPFSVAKVTRLEDQLVSAAGIEIGNRPPDLAHWSPGVDVEVFRILPT